MLYDARVVRFIKTTSETPVSKNTNADFICLGHFDMMHIARLDNITTEPLLAIQYDRDNIGESSFGCLENNVYSLYILKSAKEESAAEINEFFCSKSSYTAVTRIHCDYPNGWNQEKIPFSTKIEQYCRAQNQPDAKVVYQVPARGADSCIISFCSSINEDKEKTDVFCLFYDSLELGDTVSIIKSNSIAAILEVIRCLSANNHVRDSYTYCGIRRELLQSSDLPTEDFVPQGAKLAYISTRFSVRNGQNASVFFSKLAKSENTDIQQFYVTGTADQAFNWQNTKEEHLIKIMRFLTQNGEDIHYCFNDVITRIGIAQEIRKNNDRDIKYIKDYDIKLRIDNLHYTMTWLREEYKTSISINWKYTLLKLLGNLEAMYSNYVMDDLAELIIPSVKAFLVRLNYLRNENNGAIPDEFDEDIIAFLGYWAGLLNDISFLESQLTQHPELSPVRYYIPAMILRFELCFVKQCCKALSDKSCREFAPMLLPVDAMSLKTYCPLDPHHENYDLSCPLLVFIPFKDLYRPWETAMRVTHETAHYCESKSRNRVKRHKMIVECSAMFIVEYWYQLYIAKSLVDTQGELRKNSTEYAKALAKELCIDLDNKYSNEQWYLSQTLDAVTHRITNLIVSQEYLEQYLFAVSPEYFYKNQKSYRQIRNRMQHAANCIALEKNFDDYLRLIEFLCAECYADIAMVLLLDCDFKDYFVSVYMDEYYRFIQEENETAYLIKDPYVMRQIVRMALVIQAVNYSKPQSKSWKLENISVDQKELLPIVQCSVAIIEQIVTKKEYPFLSNTLLDSAFINSDDFIRIETYLAECAQLILEELGDHCSERIMAVKSVRESIRYVRHDNFTWYEIQKFILTQSDS